MLKRGLAVLVVLSSLFGSADKARGDLVFPSSGVWSGPRIYHGTKLVPDITNMAPDSYTFKTRVENDSQQQATNTLIGWINGPENYNWDYWGQISVDGDDYTTRQRTETISTEGDYSLYFQLGSGETISRDFHITPEPATLGLVGAGLAAAWLGRRRR